MSVGRERTEDGLPPRVMTDRDAAHLFVHAYETNSMRAWCDALREWNDRPYVGEIGAAVKALRIDWYHDGTAAARALNVDHAYLWRLAIGGKENPHKDLLCRMGLRRVVSYTRIK